MPTFLQAITQSRVVPGRQLSHYRLLEVSCTSAPACIPPAVAHCLLLVCFPLTPLQTRDWE